MEYLALNGLSATHNETRCSLASLGIHSTLDPPCFQGLNGLKSTGLRLAM